MQSETSIIEFLFWAGIVIVLAAILLSLGITIGALQYIAATTPNAMPLRITLENYGLNLLGDFLAGIFAPLAFIGLAGAFVLQRKQLLLARAEKTANEFRNSQQVIAEENAARLNYAATQANYKLSLYDKRKAAFDRITRFSTTYKFAISNKQLDELKATIFDARFVFPDELNDWLQSLLRNAESIRLHEINIPAMQKLRDENPTMWTRELNDTLVNSANELLRAKRILHEELLSEALFKRFEPFMGLPSMIEYEKVKSVKSTSEA